MGIQFYSLILFLLVLCSAFFSASEASVLGFSEERIYRLLKEKPSNHKILEHLIKKKDKLLSMVLIGNNASNIMAASIGAVLFDNSDFFQDATIAAMFNALVMTLSLVIFGELLPKRYVSQGRQEKVFLFLSPVLWFFDKILALPVKFIDIAISLLSRPFGINNMDPNSIHDSAHEDLKNAVEYKHHQGLLMKDDKDMFSGLLSLRDVEVCEVMQPKGEIFALEVNTPPKYMLGQVVQSQYSRIPVFEGNIDNIIGVLHIRDLFDFINKHKADKEMKDASKAIHECGTSKTKFVEELKGILKKPMFVPETASLRTQLMRFKKMKTHIAVVIDEHGHTSGLVTLEDIIEEIVGEINDEHDTEDNDIVEFENGVISVTGDTLIRDFCRKFDVEVGDHEATTMAGLIVEHLKRIPIDGEVLSLFGYNITISEATPKVITRIEMKRIDAEDERK